MSDSSSSLSPFDAGRGSQSTNARSARVYCVLAYSHRSCSQQTFDGEGVDLISFLGKKIKDLPAVREMDRNTVSVRTTYTAAPMTRYQCVDVRWHSQNDDEGYYSCVADSKDEYLIYHDYTEDLTHHGHHYEEIGTCPWSNEGVSE